MMPKSRNNHIDDLWEQFDRSEYLYEKTGFYEHAVEKKRLTDEIKRLHQFGEREQ